MLTRLLVALALVAPVATAGGADRTSMPSWRACSPAATRTGRSFSSTSSRSARRSRWTAPAASRLYGFAREYSWFIRDGVFIRSPLKADGVTIGEAERRRAEDRWRTPRAAAGRATRRRAGSTGLEPRFVSSAYFLEFKFDPGQYALAGREQLDGRDVLRIEYYPTKLFSEGRTRPNRRAPRAGRRRSRRR